GQDHVQGYLADCLAHLRVKHADRGQRGKTPLFEFDREDIDRKQREEEDGRGKAYKGNGGDGVVGQRVLAQGGEDANEESENDNDDLGRDHEQQRVGDAVADDLPGGLTTLDERITEVAAHDAAARALRLGHAVTVYIDHDPVVADEPVAVLAIHWLVEAQLPGQALTVGRAGDATAAHRRDGIAHLAHEEEENNADEE